MWEIHLNFRIDYAISDPYNDIYINSLLIFTFLTINTIPWSKERQNWLFCLVQVGDLKLWRICFFPFRWSRFLHLCTYERVVSHVIWKMTSSAQITDPSKKEMTMKLCKWFPKAFVFLNKQKVICKYKDLNKSQRIHIAQYVSQDFK